MVSAEIAADELVRMAPDELGAHGLDRVADGEVACLLADLREEYDLEDCVAQFFAQLRGGAALNGFQDFVGLFEQKRAE